MPKKNHIYKVDFCFLAVKPFIETQGFGTDPFKVNKKILLCFKIQKNKTCHFVIHILSFILKKASLTAKNT